MTSWRDNILREFPPQRARLTLVADPDNLLLEQGVLEGIRERGYALIPFEDEVEFRYAYESRFRSQWDRGEKTDLVVVLRSASSELDALPYDLLQAGSKLSFNLGSLFPNLSYPVVSALDRADLDSLYGAQMKNKTERLGDKATKDFILRHVFDIMPELIKEPQDLLKVLLRRHYLNLRIPPILDEYLVQLLHQVDQFKDWPLRSIVSSRDAFFEFLQERWLPFLDSVSQVKQSGVCEEQANYGFKLQGPALLPFDHKDVRIYIDNLFLEGWLRPVAHGQIEKFANSWMAYGIQVSPKEDRHRRIKGLLDSIDETLPSESDRYGKWFQFAYRWAELLALVLQTDNLNEEIWDRIRCFRLRIDESFTKWVKRSYESLSNLPPVVKLHHIPKFLASVLDNEREGKIALLVLDGLALDQWVVIREELRKRDKGLRFSSEKAVFACIPTVTTISRQAIFAGKLPLYFSESIRTTTKEPCHWEQFWVNQGLLEVNVAYKKGLGDGPMDDLEELLSQPNLRVAGLVVDKVDRIMHGMELGAAGMHNQVRQWVQQGYLLDLIYLLHKLGFQVYLTSDHGNIEAKGMGKPAEGVIADIRGSRVRVYPDANLRARTKNEYPDSMEWTSSELPENYFPLLALKDKAFVQVGKTIVSHGGISLQELIVPLVKIERSN